jgi:hypothetical protein
MSKIQYREMSLSEVIEDSNLVVEVKFIESYQEEVSVALKNASGATTETFPPFIKRGNTFEVKKVLKNDTKIKIPDTIKVPDENWRRSLSQHKEKHLNAPSKSYTVPEYITPLKSSSKASVLFLNYFQDMYELTARNAFEDKAALEKVEMLIAGE